MSDVVRIETTETVTVDGDVTTVVSVAAASGSSSGSGAPTDAGYLVTVSDATLTAEVVVGTAPGGELGGTWASPTVGATHSGSSHVGIQAAAEATAAAALTAHESDTTSVHGITDTATLYRAGGTDVAVADGGTGSSTASGARTNLGLVIGTDVAAFVHSHTTGDVTGFDEQSQDAVGTILVDTATIDLTYNDAAPSISAAIVAGSVGPTELAATTVTAGSYGSGSAVPSFTVDADGRITAAATHAIADSPAVMVLSRAYFK